MRTLNRTIAIGLYMADHRFLGRAVLPAVEALQLLAGEVKREWGLDVSQADTVEFLRFLDLPQTPAADVIVEMEWRGERILTRLCSTTGSRSGAMTRKLEQVRAAFGPDEGAPIPPQDFVVPGSGATLSVRPEDIYREAVPFGPAFRNIIGPAHLTADGASARVHAREIESLPGPSGSPFPLDAAFQLACLWGQRFRGLVGFPVGFARRRIFRLTESGRDYQAWVSAGRPEGDDLLFDLRLLDQDGRVMEAMEGLRMKDISRGRLKPPDWLIGEQAVAHLARLEDRGSAFPVSQAGGTFRGQGEDRKLG
ncbi:MAG: polyketide synthase dehydratase domain-containing protein [Deltaproteobacteria bacterium]|nr:polyketide synthase dehydratase domain-containing protein [Deltaproteobacteria bacterium]